MDGLSPLARAKGVHIIEDAAHGLAGSWRGQPLGTLGDAGCFSFHETKNITCGEGGALAVRDPELGKRAEIVREKGTNRSAFFRGEVDKYTWVAEGSSYILADPLAALLDAQLDRLEEIQTRRRGIYERYLEGLSSWAASQGMQLPRARPEHGPSFHIFYVLYPDESQRDHAIAALKSKGIQASFHYVPLHLSPHGRAFAMSAALPVTESVAARLLRLPLHPQLSHADVERVIEAVRLTSSS
jgi:dTDP-4-amino-4,6-dideoxygalactose transaminase